jgi:hypothetical protein
MTIERCQLGEADGGIGAGRVQRIESASSYQ